MIKYFCDACGVEIPIVKKKNILTGRYDEVLDRGKFECEQINLSFLNDRIQNPHIHICKHCAKEISLQIDNDLLNLKLELLSKENRI